MKKIFSIISTAVVAIGLLTACSDDNGSNPTLVQPAEGTFTVNEPEFKNQVVDLDATDHITLTWNQPVYTAEGAAIGYYLGSGSTYEVRLSLNGNFSVAYDASKLSEEGIYDGTADYVALDDIFSETVSNVTCSSINVALNKLNRASEEANWEEDTQIPAKTVYVQVISKIVDGGSNVKASVASNTVDFKAQPYYYNVASKTEYYLWMPGNGNGWDHSVAPVLTSTDNQIFTGYAYMDGEFKFTPAADWSSEYNNSSFTTATGGVDLGDGGGGNIGFTGTAGMYMLTVDLGAKSISAVPVEWGVIGDFNGWDLGSYVVMTYNTTNHCLEADANVTSAGWKFTRDAAWDVNLGGDLDDLQYNGSDITVAGSKVQLFIERPGQDKLHAKVK